MKSAIGLREDLLIKLTPDERRTLIQLYVRACAGARLAAVIEYPTMARGTANACREFLTVWCDRFRLSDDRGAA